LGRSYHSCGRTLSAELVIPQNCEVDVLDSQAGAFEQAQPGTIEEGSHKPGRAVQLEDDRAHLVAGHNDGKACRSLGPDDVVEPWQVLMQDVTVRNRSALSAWF